MLYLSWGLFLIIPGRLLGDSLFIGEPDTPPLRGREFGCGWAPGELTTDEAEEEEEEEEITVAVREGWTVVVS